MSAKISFEIRQQHPLARRLIVLIALLAMGAGLTPLFSQVVSGLRLTANDGAPFDRFGVSLSLDGDNIIAGAPGHDALGSESGAAYIFTRMDTTWLETTKLTAGDGAAGDQFGFSVAINGDYAFVTLKIYNLTGEEITTLTAEQHPREIIK